MLKSVVIGSIFTVLTVVLQSLNLVWLFATPWTAARQASLSIISQSLFKLMSIESVMPPNHLIFCQPLLLLPSIFPSTRVFSNVCHLFGIRWPKYWSFSFSFSISPSNEYSGLISFRIGWFDLTVKESLNRLQHISKASILWRSAFFVVQLSHPFMTTGKTIALCGPLSVKWCLCFLICWDLYLEDSMVDANITLDGW